MLMALTLTNVERYTENWTWSYIKTGSQVVYITVEFVCQVFTAFHLCPLSRHCGTRRQISNFSLGQIVVVDILCVLWRHGRQEGRKVALFFFLPFLARQNLCQSVWTIFCKKNRPFFLCTPINFCFHANWERLSFFFSLPCLWNAGYFAEEGFLFRPWQIAA